jgi:signal transducing adaptor molecule
VAAEQRQQKLEYQKQLQAQQLQQAKEQQAREQQAREQQAREQQAREQAAAVAASSPIPTISTPTATNTSPAPNVNIVTRVRALYTFEPTEPGELAFEKGDIIKVVDRGYKDWWRGQLKGRTGIFPVNYVVGFPELFSCPAFLSCAIIGTNA